jgi:hypothetical protein
VGGVLAGEPPAHRATVRSESIIEVRSR